MRMPGILIGMRSSPTTPLALPVKIVDLRCRAGGRLLRFLTGFLWVYIGLRDSMVNDRRLPNGLCAIEL